MYQSSWAKPLNWGPMSKWTKNSESAFIFTQNGQKSQLFFKIQVVDPFSEYVNLN